MNEVKYFFFQEKMGENLVKTNPINFIDRRPIEPAPILQLHWENCSDEEIK